LIELRFDESDSRNYKTSRLRSIINFLKYRKYDLSRLIFAISEGGDEATTLWIVPPGAKLPASRRVPSQSISEKNNQIVKAEELFQRINELCLRNGSNTKKKRV
jgi:hypothetical protein